MKTGKLISVLFLISAFLLIILPITGNNDISNDGFKVYPNPVTDKLTITGDSEILVVYLFTVSGELLEKEFPNSKIYTMDLSRYRTGTYFLRVTTDDMSVYSETIIKK